MDLSSSGENNEATSQQALIESIEELRPLLITYAYNILGTVDEAQDIVQDAVLQFIRTNRGYVLNIKSYLIRSVINLAINQKKRQKKMQADYPGQWLPEPVAADGADTLINRKDILSYSLMVLLERLNARQRAVFILKEAFDYEHSEIGEVIGITEEHSRQLLSRAKKQIKTASVIPNAANRDEIFHRYVDVIRRGDTSQLELMLNQDIVMISDGGGKVSASRNPIHGKKDTMAMLLGLHKKFYNQLDVKYTLVNHQPALLYFDKDVLVNCHIITIENDCITGVYVIRNPDKLKLLQKRA